MSIKRTHKKQCPNCEPGRLVYKEIVRIEDETKYHHECDSCEYEEDLARPYPFQEVIYDTEDEVVE